MQHLIHKIRIEYFLWLGVITYGVFFSLYQISRHQSFQTGLDLVSVEQPLWNTLHGQFLRSTYYPVTGEIVTNFTNSKTESLLGDHVQPTLLLLLPFYALIPRAETLAVILSVAVGLGAIPLFRIVRRRIGSERWALAFSFAYLLLPAIQTNTAHDIHMANFLPPILLAAIDALDRGHIRLWWLWVLLAMGCREDVPLLVGWAMFLFAYRSKRLNAFAMMGFGAVISFFSIWVIIPHFGGNASYFSRFVPLGTEISTAGLLSLIKDPHFILSEVIRFLSYNLRLGTPFLFFYLFSPIALLAMAPTIVMNGLSWYDVSLFPNLAHYSSVIIAFAFVGSADGLVKISNSLAKKFPKYNWRGVIGVAFFTSITASQFLSGYTPLSINFQWPSLTGREAAFEMALAIIPANASISSESRLAGHLAQRSTLRFFPDMRQVDWVIVDAWTGRYPFYQPMEDITKSWQSLLSDPKWETAYAHDGLIVLKRGTGPPQAIINAFQPPPGSELSPLLVHFGDEEQGMNLIGLASIRISPELISICSDWKVQEAGTLQPFLGYTYGSVSQVAEPLAGTVFLPSLFTQPENVRDCTPILALVKKNTIIARLMVSEGSRRLSITLPANMDESGDYTVENDVLIVRVQP